MNKKRKLSKKHKQKISISNLGKKHGPMSKETKEKIMKANLGKKHSEETKRKMSETHKKFDYRVGVVMSDKTKEKLRQVNLKNDDEIGIGAIHGRIEYKYGKPKYCEICKKTNKKKYEWANKNHKYNLEIKYWMRVCTSCHRLYDIKHNNYRNFYAKNWKNRKSKQRS